MHRLHCNKFFSISNEGDFHSRSVKLISIRQTINFSYRKSLFFSNSMSGNLNENQFLLDFSRFFFFTNQLFQRKTSENLKIPVRVHSKQANLCLCYNICFMLSWVFAATKAATQVTDEVFKFPMYQPFSSRSFESMLKTIQKNHFNGTYCPLTENSQVSAKLFVRTF